MQYVTIRRPGGFERLELCQAPSREPGPNQVRVRVRAIGVNYADCVVRMGLYESAKKYVGWPITPGFEFSGWVDRVGSEVTDFEPGQRVLGVTRFGAYTSEIVVEPWQLFPVPDCLSLDQAGAFPVVHLTAWVALRELCVLRPGTRVLVHSAAGGVGSAAVHIATAAQATVVGVVGATHKVEVARSNGCEHVIDKSQSKPWHELERLYPDGVDVILDPNGPETLRAGYRHLRPMGRLVIYGFQSMLPRGRGKPSWWRLLFTYLKTPRFHPLRMTNENRSVLAFNLSYLFERSGLFREVMRELLGLLEAGRIRPLPIQRFALTQVADAHRALQSGSTTGKLVLVTDADAGEASEPAG